jgi:hypothetical protein
MKIMKIFALSSTNIIIFQIGLDLIKANNIN